MEYQTVNGLERVLDSRRCEWVVPPVNGPGEGADGNGERVNGSSSTCE